MQLDVLDYAEALGWPTDRMEVLDARGESGSQGDREIFHRLLARVKAGGVGCVAFARSDRLSRTSLESSELLQAAAEHHTLILTEGRVYNPASASDKLILGIMAEFAEYENRARSLWMMLTRLALAKEAAYRVVLPTGLIAGSPSDPKFVGELENAGLGHYLGDLESHRAVSTRKGMKHYVLPYPDEEIYRACRMRMDCMLSTYSVEAVVDMIQNDSNYPRPGQLPVTKAITRYHDGIRVSWKDIDSNAGRALLRRWFRSPALYGIYKFSSARLMELNPDAPKEQYRVWIPEAFPSFASQDDYPRVRRALKGDLRPWQIGGYDGPRTHLLDVLRCGEVREDGTRCRLKMLAWYQPNGTWGYYSHQCRSYGHKAQHVRDVSIEPIVESVIEEVLDPELLDAALSSLEVVSSRAGERLAGLRQKQRQLGRKLEGAQKAVVQAELDNAPDRRLFFNNVIDEALKERRTLDGVIAEAEADLERVVDVAERDRDRLLSLAADIRAIIHRGRSVQPDAVRMLISEIVSEILFERISGFVCLLQFRFPGGGSIERTVITRPMNAPRAALAYAAGRLAEGGAPKAVACELNAAPPKNHSVTWTKRRVLSAPHILEHQEQPSLRRGEHRGLGEISAQAGAAYEDVFIAAIQGDLGPGYYEDGELYVHPTDQELHRWVPAVAAAWVAANKGWDRSELILRSEAAQLTGLCKGAITYRANRRAGTARDAGGRVWVRRKDVL